MSPVSPTFHQVTADVVANVRVAESTFKVRVDAPEIACRVRAGQFVMIRMTGLNAPLIGRALAVWDVEGDAIELIYVRKGALTRVLSEALPGSAVTLWGPLGNGFDLRPCRELIIAVGGIGQTPMLMLGRTMLREQICRRVTVVYGARRASLLAGVDDFRAAGFEVTVCTDDGSTGRRGFVPDVLADHLSGDDVRVVTCGPEIMMQKVAELCERRDIDCQVSMETPMACGIGICYSCVAKVRQPDGDWDYKRTCIEGPIFDGPQIVWD